MYPVNEVLETCSGPNLVSQKFVRTEWKVEKNTINDPEMTTATKQAVVVGVNLLPCTSGIPPILILTRNSQQVLGTPLTRNVLYRQICLS